jgi:hypothetical protein
MSIFSALSTLFSGSQSTTAPVMGVSNWPKPVVIYDQGTVPDDSFVQHEGFPHNSDRFDSFLSGALAVAQPATMFAPDWMKPAAVLVYNDGNHDPLGFDRISRRLWSLPGAFCTLSLGDC